MLRTFLLFAAFFGFTAVALGAFAAHGLKSQLSADLLAVFQTGVHYQMVHALALLAVTKLLGGRATLPKHLAAVALAAAPLVLLIGLYIPDLAGVLTIPMAGAIHYYARILALIGLVWAGLLLLRTISLAHEISVWRTFGAITLTWVVLYVLVPLAGIFLTGYLLA